MATLASLEAVQKAYIAYYGRPADPAGLEYWAGRADAEGMEAIIDAFGNSAEANELFGGMSTTAMLNTLYNQIFGRDADPEGLAYYTAELDAGRMTPASIALNIIDGAQGGDATIVANKVEVANNFTNALDTAEEVAAYNADAAPAVRNMLATVGEGTDVDSFNGIEPVLAEILNPNDVFTLTEVTTEVAATYYDPVLVTMWGYNPHGHGETDVDNMDGDNAATDTYDDEDANAEGNANNLTNEGPLDGGVPLSTLVAYLEDIDGFDWQNLDLIDEDDLNTGVATVTNTQDDNGTINISITDSDGEVAYATVEMGDYVYGLINNLLFDSENNSRLFQTEMYIARDDNGNIINDGNGNPIYTHIAPVDEEATTVSSPIILTTSQNNGGTEETGFTSAADDLIVAARLELLHGAYIDGGAGNNTLEIDAKGHFAQPKELLNIQSIKIENLPNIYTLADDDNTNDYPDVNENNAGIETASVIDITRAGDLQTLTITEGNFEELDGQETAGSLTVTGIRNGAVTTLDGSFTQDVTLHYGELQGAGVQLVFNNLSMGDVEGAQLVVAHNAEELTIETTGGDSFLANGDLGGELTTLTITGTEHLHISGDLDDSFQDETPVTIDASGNTGGVDLELSNSEQVTFIGSSANDRFNVSTSDVSDDFENDQYVVIEGGEGNNYYVIDTYMATITNGDGNNNYEVDFDKGTLTAGNGNNFIEGNVVNFTATLGDGNNYVELDAGDATDSSELGIEDFPTAVNLTLGNGANEINVDAGTGEDSSVTVVAGDGGNNIEVSATDVSLTTGVGDDVIDASGNSITIDSGAGNDTITIDGQDDDYVTESDNETAADNGVLLNINTGTGSSVINLGRDTDNADDGVNSDNATLTAKEGSVITGEDITLVVKTDADLRVADLSGITSVILDDDNQTVSGQGYAGGDSAVLTLTDSQFMALGADAFSVEGSSFGAHAIVEIIVTETTTLDDLLGAAAPLGLNDGVKLRLFVEDGVEVTMTAEQLHKLITQDGVQQAQPAVNYEAPGQVFITDAGYNFEAFEAADEGDNSVYSGDLGTVTAGFGASNVHITRTADGFERPAPTSSSDDFLVEDGDTINNFERVFDDGGAIEWMNVIADEPGARININVTTGETVGEAGIESGGIHSENVSTFVVTGFNTAANNDGDALVSQGIASTATIYVCDSTEGVEVLGLQNNRLSTVTFNQVNWGTELLMEGDGYANSSEQEKKLGNPDLSEVGEIIANFFENGANAVVNINNQGVELGMNEDAEDGYDANGERVLDVKGIEVNNADRLLINVADGDAVINRVAGDAIERLIVTGTEDVTLHIDADDIDFGDLLSIDGSAVTDSFTLVLDGTGDSYDLSGVTLTGVDAIVLGDNVTVTMTADQVVEFGAVISQTDDNATLNVVELSDQALDLTTVDVETIDTVTFADVDGTITVNAATDFADATSVTILAEDSDTAVEMTAAQFGTITGGTVDVTEAGTNDATLVLTDLANDETLTLSNVDGDADVVLRVSDLVATEDMEIVEDGDVDSITLEVTGTVDLTEADLTGVDINNVDIADGASLTLTAAQAEAIGIDDADGDGVADNWTGTGTLNIVDLEDETLDLDAVADAGLTIGTITIENTDAAITIDAGTTFGGATEIITPTAEAGSPDFGTENTTVTMSVDQFLSSAGLISGDSQINLTGLYNNVDTDGDFVVDSANFDFSGIANAGTITFAADTDGAAGSDNDVITLTDTADLGGFAVELGNGDLIRFATEAQAGRQIIVDGAAPTGVQWLWTVFGAEVDTSEYDEDLTTLFIDEALLVSQPIEENLWTSLDGSIVVEKINGETIPELVKYDRVNTFEAFTNIGAGINYDDDAAFGTVANLTMNLEGEVNLGNILLGDTNNGDGSTPNIDGVGFFETLVINSYKDLTNVDGYDPLSNDVPGRVISTNYLGDISLNAGSVDELVDITINTYDDVDNVIGTGDDADGYLDAENVNGAAAERDGMDIEVGTITFDDSDTEDGVSLTLTGANDITIEAVDISDADISLLSIDANDHSGDLEIGGIEPTGGLNDFGEIYVLDGYTGDDALGDAADGAGANDMLVITNGDNDLTDATLDIEALHVTGDSTITLTEAQVQAIGEGNFSIAAGVTVTLNVTEIPNGSDIDLNAIQDAGFNIGTISTADADVTLDDTATLGGADEFQVVLNDNNRTLTLTATQYLQLNGGNITENDTDATTTETASVTITDVVDASNRTAIDNPNNDVRWSVNLDLSTVSTTGTHTLDIADTAAAADVTFDNTSDLAGFAVELDDLDDANQGDGVANETANELAGQTVRFTTEAQAGRTVNVEGYDPGVVEVLPATVLGDGEADTNVVWDFDSVTGPIDTSNYDQELGRLWVSDELVKSDNDLEDLFSASDLNGNSLQDDINLNGDIIVRIVNTQNLALIDYQSQGVSRQLEIEAFTDLSGTGLVFDEQDQLVDIDNLDIDLGGDVQLGDLTIDNIIQTTNTDPDSDQFGTLTINSLLANTQGHYLLPEDHVWGTNVVPTGENVIGDISAGTTRNELTNVIINATDVGVIINEIFFAEEDGAGATADFEVNGDNDVTVKSLDTSDSGVVGLTVDNNLAGATLTVTGGSPAFGGGAVGGLTETLTIESVATATTTFGSAKTAPATGEWAGIYGETLSLIDLSGAGTVNLGTIAGVDTEDFTITTNAATADSDGVAFTGTVNLTLGEADADGLTAPELSATGTWVLDFTGATANVTITDDVTFNAGGQLAITNATLDISSAVNLAVLGDGLSLTNVTIDVPAGASLTLTPAQADTLTITGEGDVIITTLDDAAFNDAAGVNGDLDLSGIMTGTGDTGTVSLAIDSTGDIDLLASDLGVAAVAITGTGSVDATGADLAGADRNDPATGGDVSDDTFPSFTVGTGSTLQITATQAGNASGVATADYALTATGLGTVAVGDLGTNPDADLSGLATTSVTATVEQNTEFTGDLGTAVVTVFDGFTLTADYSIVTGKTINEQAAPAGTGTLVVDIAAASAAADLSTITSDMDAAQITANFVEDMTFTGDLDGHNATVGTDAADVDLVVSAAIISGLTVTTADADDSIHIPDLATNLTADLSGITGAGTETAAFDADGTFTGDLGTVNVTVADDVTMTAAASILSDAIVNKSGSGSDNGAIAVTLSNAVAGDATVDLTTIPGQAADNAGVTDAPVLASVTVLNDLTFTGTLINGVQVADGATLTVAADVIDGITVDAAGTTGAVTIDATTVTDTDLNLAGSANYTVNTLTDTLTATGVTGSLSVVTGDANLAIALGAGTNTIDGDALTAGNTITVTGSDTSATVTTENGNIDGSGVTNDDADTTTGGLTLNGGDGQNTITGGANDDVINGGVDADNLVGGAGDDTFVIDAVLDVVTGETINGGADTDTVEINTTLAIDLSLANSSNLEILDLSNVDANVTITGAQLNDFSGATGLVQANATDNLTIDTLTGLTVDATNGTDTFVFTSTDTGVSITGFTTTVDNIDVQNFGDGDGVLTTVAGALTTTANEVYFLSTGVAGDADSAAASAAAATAAAAWTDANATAYLIVADDNSTAVYQFVDTAASADEVATGELTLIGTIDEVLVAGDIVA